MVFRVFQCYPLFGLQDSVTGTFRYFRVFYGQILANFGQIIGPRQNFQLKVVDLQKMRVCVQNFFCRTVHFRENWIFQENRSEISVTTLLN